ncbi:MAG: hypothetical protein OQK48_04110 [Sulfurimonas sp.]|uniref:hypothetical protein n=1 Tax=Sulfurimonas sp. TaxID=2022749 RepID=UPI00262AE33E|nr:hypothetical protein [Sulfurimonas sp.]MCW8894487.1 hypothetical protein [Sulfurimonas sp.]MCW8954104.1 hypothetical protein [Sulfurimonas sp.]MCW9067832.1 hypothetical protein [Sulfurimonas sp.]
MHIKRYTIAALALIVLIGWYVYAFVTQESISIELFGIALPSLSIAMWVVLPLILLYAASVIHMSFYSFLGSLKLRKYEKDYEKIVDSMVDAYLGKENRSHTFKTDRYKLLGALVDNATIFPVGEFDADINNKKISEVLELINKVREGEVVDLKKYSLPSFNQLAIQNERNRYKKGDLTAEDIISHSNKYDESLCKDVYVDFVKEAPLNAIEKYKKYLTKDALFEILSRVNAEKNTLEVSNDALISLFNELDLSSSDYIEASQKLSKGMIPEQRIKLFETLSNQNENIVEAYLFTLFDLEMLAPTKEILDNSQDNEYIQFKAYSSLRECGKHFDINLFI